MLSGLAESTQPFLPSNANPAAQPRPRGADHVRVEYVSDMLMRPVLEAARAAQAASALRPGLQEIVPASPDDARPGIEAFTQPVLVITCDGT